MSSIPQYREVHLSLEQSGFCVFEMDEGQSLDSIALDLGRPVPSVLGRSATDFLSPRAPDEAKSGTFSSIFGMGSFPLHTETAYWYRPIDILILRCINPGQGNRPTVLVDGWRLGFAEDEMNELTSSLMVVKSRSNSFLAPLLTPSEQKASFRFDQNCMKPATKLDRLAFEVLVNGLSKADKIEINWTRRTCLILDNHRVLHSRGTSAIPDENRGS